MINIFGLEDGFASQLQGTKLKSFVQNSVGKNYEINNYVLILCSTISLGIASFRSMVRSFQSIDRSFHEIVSSFHKKSQFVPRILYIFLEV